MKKSKNEIPQKSTLEYTFDELFQKEVVMGLDNFNMAVYGKPSREFKLGELVIFGNLKNCIIVHSYGNGIYVLEFDAIQHNRLQDAKKYNRERMVRKWIDIKKITQSGDSKFAFDVYPRPSYLSSSLDSILFMYTHHGILMDTRFQRDYVWDIKDRDSLLDTIFNQGSIGSFLFSRLAGYKFKDSKEIEKFKTITGDVIDIPKCKNNSISVIDGQQRITTLLNFYLGRFAYNGYFFDELSAKDTYTFLNSPITYAIVDESYGYDLKSLVWLFIQSNKGVSQSSEHLAKMEEYYNGIK